MVKHLPANAGDVSSFPGSGKSPGEGNGNPLQDSCLGNPMNRGAWWATHSTGWQRLEHNWATEHTHTHTYTQHHLQEAFFVPPSCSFSLRISTIHYVLVQMREALVDIVQRTRGSDSYSTMNCVCDSKQFTSSLWNVMYSVIHSISNISLFPLYGAHILVGEIGN